MNSLASGSCTVSLLSIVHLHTVLLLIFLFSLSLYSQSIMRRGFRRACFTLISRHRSIILSPRWLWSHAVGFISDKKHMYIIHGSAKRLSCDHRLGFCCMNSLLRLLLPSLSSLCSFIQSPWIGDFFRRYQARSATSGHNQRNDMNSFVS